MPSSRTCLHEIGTHQSLLNLVANYEIIFLNNHCYLIVYRLQFSLIEFLRKFRPAIMNVVVIKCFCYRIAGQSDVHRLVLFTSRRPQL